jgi:hypothetical protein
VRIDRIVPNPNMQGRKLEVWSPHEWATDGVREASRSYALDSPAPGECTVSRMSASAGTEMYWPDR